MHLLYYLYLPSKLRQPSLAAGSKSTPRFQKESSLSFPLDSLPNSLLQQVISFFFPHIGTSQLKTANIYSFKYCPFLILTRTRLLLCLRPTLFIPTTTRKLFQFLSLILRHLHLLLPLFTFVILLYCIFVLLLIIIVWPWWLPPRVFPLIGRLFIGPWIWPRTRRYVRSWSNRSWTMGVGMMTWRAVTILILKLSCFVTFL